MFLDKFLKDIDETPNNTLIVKPDRGLGRILFKLGRD